MSRKPNVRFFMVKSFIAALLFAFSLSAFAQNQNLSNGFVFDGEPYIAINPTNSKHLVVAWMGFVNFAQRFQIKTRTSFDGGQTWSNTVNIPHEVAGYSSADPSLDFDENGNPVVCYIDFTGTTPPISGAVYIRKSSDGGLTWGNAKEVINANYDGTKWPIDRPWIKIDKSNSTLQGAIYVTTMNGNRTNAPFNPYLSVSQNGGNTFSTRYLDTTGWLAGSLINLPMCSPALSSAGVFYGVYPSYVIAQSLFTQALLVRSADGGASLGHKLVRTVNPPTQNGNFPNAKKGSLLLTNPANANHLATIYPSAETGDIDIYYIESLDEGTSWSAPLRVNDDPLNNGKMQDLLWGDFDDDGDLVIGWRDRRHGSAGTYATSSEIWAAVRYADSSQFEANFQLTNQLVAFDSVLNESGNDFMCIDIEHDTIYAVWGDVRSGNINIWFQKTDLYGNLLSIQSLANDHEPLVMAYPNPVIDELVIDGKDLKTIELYNAKGILVKKMENSTGKTNIHLKTTDMPAGTYILHLETSKDSFNKTIIKN